MKLRIGWAEESFVPEKKTRLGGQFYERISEGVDSPVTATAMAVESGEEKLILISADLTGFSQYMLDSVREAFHKICPEVPVEALVVSATHTHATLLLPSYSPKAGFVSNVAILSEFLPADKQYKPLVSANEDVITLEEARELVVSKIALAAKRAWENRADAYYANEFGRAAVGMCRRVG